MTAIEWTEKYRPRTLKEVLGNGKAVSDLRAWAESWERGDPQWKAVILYGPAGVGKTSAAMALVAEMDWDHIEMNASDARTASAIGRIAGSASRSMTFSGKRRLIILDEADNLHGNADRGGAAAMLKMVKNASQPTLLIANEYYGMSKPLRDACLGIRFRSIRKSTVASVLRNICKMEKVNCTPDLIEQIVEISGGDLRSAVNDLHAAAEGALDQEIDRAATSERDVRSNIFKAMDKIFKGTGPREAHRAASYLDESPEDLVHWVDENLPLVYKGPSLALGFDRLSRADVFLGRVRRRQNYGLWRYAAFMMTGGVLASRTERKRGYVAFRPPSLWRRMGQTRSARNLRDSAAAKIGRHCHLSTKRARTDLMGFFGILLKDKESAPKVAALLDLIPEEIALLMGSKPTTKKVIRIFEEGQRLREEETIEKIEFLWGDIAKKRSDDGIEEIIKEPKEPKEPDKPDRTDSQGDQRSLFDF